MSTTKIKQWRKAMRDFKKTVAEKEAQALAKDRAERFSFDYPRPDCTCVNGPGDCALHDHY